MESLKKPSGVTVAVWLFILSIALGVLDMYSSGSILREASSFHLSDVVAYIVFAVLIYLLNKGKLWAKYLYVLLIIIWYVLLIFMLVPYYNHALNVMLVALQMLLNIVGLLILFRPKCRRWYGDMK
ncbi:hypothetical protein L3V86_07645 [Thiotrichales bacterium 19S11-10]|nr:hypothetical protein [Thiotrichales bacterium 19S11-10]